MISIRVEAPNLSELLKDETRDIMRLVMLGTGGRMKSLIAEPKSGRQYKRGEKFHIASAPGDAPATDSGNLINSIMAEANGLQGEITMVEYGMYLEFGTGEIAARPFVVPSLEDVLQAL